MKELKVEKESIKEERCSNCFYNKKVPCSPLYYCDNKESELYRYTTSYNCSCEYWTEKQKGVK